MLVAKTLVVQRAAVVMVVILESVVVVVALTDAVVSQKTVVQINTQFFISSYPQ